MKKRQNIKKCHFKAFFTSKKNAKKRHHGVLPMYAHFAPLKNANFASKNLQNRSFQIIKSIISNHQINHSKSSNQSSQIIVLIIPNYQINQLNFQSKSFYFKSSQIIKINHKSHLKSTISIENTQNSHFPSKNSPKKG